MSEHDKREAALADIEASWRDISEIQVYAKLRALKDHPQRMLFGSILASALRRHAPRMLALLPPEFLDTTDDHTRQDAAE
jgi:hypothetical protein